MCRATNAWDLHEGQLDGSARRGERLADLGGSTV